MQRTARMTIEIEHITEAHRAAIEDMLKMWTTLGGLGASRWTKFFADGDGDFQPRIAVDGKKPEFSPLVKEHERWPDRSEYQIDPDWIAWRMREQP